MGFKSIDDYNEAKYSGKFVLQNDGDSELAIFLYRDRHDVMVADAHYIKSSAYNGYVHCLDRNCPACAKGIRKQTKVFIPMYLPEKDTIVFWDRTHKFIPQLDHDLFAPYPEPVSFVFTIKRNGAAGDINTRYSISATAKNHVAYDEILGKFNYKFPDFFENICKSVDAYTLSNWLSSSNHAEPSSDLPDYQITPRGGASANNMGLDDLPDMPSSSEDIDGDPDF